MFLAQSLAISFKWLGLFIRVHVRNEPKIRLNQKCLTTHPRQPEQMPNWVETTILVLPSDMATGLSIRQCWTELLNAMLAL